METKRRAVDVSSWSNVLPARTFLVDFDPAATAGPFIPRGAGRSFSDAAYLSDGLTLSSLRGARVRRLDPRARTLECDAGVSMGELHARLEASDFCFPIYGGTQWATVGGAVAADVHGKNDVGKGSFGNHVEALTLAMQDGRELRCSRREHPRCFAATLGGMGLTGYVKRVTLRLEARHRHTVRVRCREIGSVARAVERLDRTEADFQYCSWIELVRFPGMHYHASLVDRRCPPPRPSRDVYLPRVKVYNRLTLEVMHRARARYHRGLDHRVHVRAFNYSGPQETFLHWNRLFGRSGFIEYQLATRAEVFVETCERIVELARRQRKDLAIAVLKRFGPAARDGLMSFPIPGGYTLSFQIEDLPENRSFLDRVTELVLAAGGRTYLAKDSCLTPAQFEPMYDSLPRWRRIVRDVDPEHRVRSDLSDRLRLKPW